MQAAFQITNPDDVSMTLTVTMPLKAWKDIKAELSGAPHWKVGSLTGAITQMILLANERFRPSDEAGDRDREAR